MQHLHLFLLDGAIKSRVFICSMWPSSAISIVANADVRYHTREFSNSMSKTLCTDCDYIYRENAKTSEITLPPKNKFITAAYRQRSHHIESRAEHHTIALQSPPKFQT
jgi:hypothetical protein